MPSSRTLLLRVAQLPFEIADIRQGGSPCFESPRIFRRSIHRRRPSSGRPDHRVFKGRLVAGRGLTTLSPHRDGCAKARGHPARSHHSVAENFSWKVFAAIRQPRPFGRKQKETGSAYLYTIPRLPTSRRQLLLPTMRLPSREFRSSCGPRRTNNTMPWIRFMRHNPHHHHHGIVIRFLQPQSAD